MCGHATDYTGPSEETVSELKEKDREIRIMKEEAVSNQKALAQLEAVIAALKAGGAVAGAAAAPATSFRLDPKCKKYLPMIKMMMPPHVIKQKMKMGGLKPDEIEARLPLCDLCDSRVPDTASSHCYAGPLPSVFF